MAKAGGQQCREQEKEKEPRIAQLFSLRAHCSLREQSFERPPEIRAIKWIRQRELHEALEVAREVADVVPLLFLRQTHRHHPPPLLTQELDGVGELDLAALVRFDAPD